MFQTCTYDSIHKEKNMGVKRFVIVGKFVDGTGAALRRNIFLGVKDGVITDIGPVSDLPGNDSSVVDDFSHCIIVPAFVDCSVSLSRSPSVDRRVQISSENASFAEKITMLEKHVGYCYDHGVLGVADSDNISDLVNRSQEEMTEVNMVDIKISSQFSPSRENYIADNPGEDFIKINRFGNIDGEETAHPQLDNEELCRIMHQTKEKVVVVANGVQQVGDALAAGCDAIEQGYCMGEENLKKMAAEGVVWIPSVLRAKNGLNSASAGGNVCCRFAQSCLTPGKPVLEADKFWKKMLAEQLNQLRLARQLGVTTLIGTGAGSAGILHGESMVEEMKLFMKADYSLEETVRSATENGAQFFGMENLGALTVGRKATFLITKGTVKQLPRKLSYLEGIWVDGAPSTSYRKNPIKVAP
ncbi:hypothetical protein DP2100 [Desulfotalea psychrophila LSv54]|uniref:Amidohydrolase-related domain-containing protein n=2 Tax=Desulfotalea psychrophila TaxID=84980 RepID=Q6ALE6_DESPS|nr:hypothetical protein DP2100 [Desulfotalea psychrophila LSv54]